MSWPSVLRHIVLVRDVVVQMSVCVSAVRGRLNFGFVYGAETASKMTFGPVLFSANVVSAEFPLRP